MSTAAAASRAAPPVQRKQQVEQVRHSLEALKPQMALALPRHLTPERLLRVAMTAVQNTPKLLDCDRTSFYAAIMMCAQLGLEPDGVLGQAYLVPFNGKVQFIPGYRGLLFLARNSGEISSIQAHEVCENDEFDYAYGLNERLDHKPAEGERGEITHFYAYAKFKDGGHVFEVMTRQQVEAVRDKSEGYRAFLAKKIKTNPWNDHFVEMGRKTLIRRLAKYLPLAVQRAAAIEDAADRGVAASLDRYGEIILQPEEDPQAIEDQSAAADATTEKLDRLAGGAVETKAETQQEPAEAQPQPAPAQDDRLDIPASLDRRPGRGKAAKAQPAPDPAPAIETDAGDEDFADDAGPSGADEELPNWFSAEA